MSLCHSFIWDYFTVNKDRTLACCNDPSCKHHEHPYACHISTLRRHLKKHPQWLAELEEKETKQEQEQKNVIENYTINFKVKYKYVFFSLLII